MFQGVYAGKRVLVTGHTGFKGSWLSQWLIELGAKVAGFSIGIPSNPSHYEVLKLPELLKNYTGDIRDLGAFQRALDEFKPEIVFHLAAQAIVRLSFDDPKLTFDTNLGGTVNVMEALRKTPSIKTAVIITSDKCYENVEWEFGYRETDRLGGKDPYSASKACAEIAFSAYARSYFLTSGSTRVASARAGNVIGGGDWAKDRIIPDCVRAWANGQNPVIRNPRSTRPWQHVLEPLSGYLWLGARLIQTPENLIGESFNFGPPADVNQPVAELIEEMGKTWAASSWKHDLQTAGTQKHEAGLLKLSCDKALHRLQWQPTLVFPETVRMTAEWYKEFYETKKESSARTLTQIREYQALALKRGRLWALT